MISPIKLFKSKKPFDLIESNVKGFTMKNWKTSLSGIVIGLFMLARIWAPSTYQQKITDTQVALAAIGLVAAKDGSTHSTSEEVDKADIKADATHN